MGDTSGRDLVMSPSTASASSPASTSSAAHESSPASTSNTAHGATAGPTAPPERPPAVDLRDPIEADLAYRISLAWRELRRGAATAALRDHFFGTDPGALEPGQMDTLDLLLTRDHWRMSELADALRVDRSTATRAVQRLVNDGLAVRSHPDGDKRVVLVQPTPEGWRRHRAVARRRITALSRLLAAFTPEERHQLAHLLGRFVDELDVLVADLAAAPDVPLRADERPADR